MNLIQTIFVQQQQLKCNIYNRIIHRQECKDKDRNASDNKIQFKKPKSTKEKEILP